MSTISAPPPSVWRSPALKPPGWAALDPSGWLRILLITLLGYALFGKGWAYLGIPPLFVGEVVLLYGAAAVFFAGKWRDLPRLLPLQLLTLLLLWGTWRTLPYVRPYGADALRDAVIFGYGVLAFIICAYLLARPERLSLVVSCFPLFAKLFLVVAPLVWIVSQFADPLIPRWPWASVPIIHSKGGDVLVHLAGIVAFWASGLGPRPRPWQVLLLVAFAAIVGIQNRGGMLAMAAVFAFCMCLKPRDATLRNMLFIAVTGAALLALSDFSFRLPGKDREVSFQQVLDNALSIAGDSSEKKLSGTKEWRLQWWSKIYNYTVDGKYFWSGKGFGINLADDDGFQGSAWEGKLRSPHNGHLTMLARAGVPGFTLWLLVQLSWAASMLHAWKVSRKAGQERWSGLFLFLMAYWLAFMANATFDVFIEGPMGGIWCWIIFGIGLAAIVIHNQQPQVLERSPENTFGPALFR